MLDNCTFERITCKKQRLKRFIQHEPLFIRHFTTTKWPFPVHNHNHFELAFIHSGSGHHVLNNVRQPYKGPCLFLLGPADYHIFEIEKETEFSVLKFSNDYLGGFSVSQSDHSWNRLIDRLLLLNAGRDEGLILSKDGISKIEKLIRLIVNEWKIAQNSSGEIIFYLFRAVFALLKKAIISDPSSAKQPSGDFVLSVADYIHSRIHHPQELQLSAISEQFHFSANYLNQLFKQQMGMPIKEYIIQHKFKLIENRLKYSSLSIKAVSEEFGFSDLSHFNKFLKNQTGLTPKSIRNSINK
jgi:AraC-like DNA-binding protein